MPRTAEIHRATAETTIDLRLDLNGAGTGEFDTKTVDPDHPITKGLEPFRTWDETYVHSKHNEKDRHVLQVRAEGDA